MKYGIEVIKGAIRVNIGDQAVEMDQDEAAMFAAAVMRRAGVKTISLRAVSGVQVQMFREHPFPKEWNGE